MSDSSDHPDDGNFVKLLIDHQASIRSFVISLLPGAPGADDVIQQTNELLWKKRRQFQPGSNFRAWALAIARILVRAHHRHLSQQHWVTLDEDLMDLISGEIAEEPDPTFESSRFNALRSCMERLRQQDRDLLIQRYWHRKRLQDFAVIHGRSPGGLRVQLARLRSQLKQCIEFRLKQFS